VASPWWQRSRPGKWSHSSFSLRLPATFCHSFGFSWNSVPGKELPAWRPAPSQGQEKSEVHKLVAYHKLVIWHLDLHIINLFWAIVGLTTLDADNDWGEVHTQPQPDFPWPPQLSPGWCQNPAAVLASFSIRNTPAGCWCLTPIILATQEAEIRRITVQSQPGQIVLETLSRKKPNTKQDWWTGSSGRAPA
jgi:hypothetical protein